VRRLKSLDPSVSVGPAGGYCFPFLIALVVAVVLAIASLAIVVHTALAVASLYVPVPWGDITIEHLWISQHGVRPMDWFRPHHEHILLLPRLLFLVDFYVFGASAVFLQTCSFLLAIGVVGVFGHVASRWFFTLRLDAGMYTCLLAAGYVNCMGLFNLVWGFMIQHWIVNFFFLLFALMFARQSVPHDSRKGWWLALALLPLGFVVVFSSGNGVMCLATATLLAVLFGLGWRKAFYFAGLLALLTFAYLLCNKSAGEAKLSVFWKIPYEAAKCYFSFLGGPGARLHVWPADDHFWHSSARWTLARGVIVFLLGTGLCLREWLQPARRTVFSVFHVFVIVLVFATGIGTVAARLPLSVYEGANTKYTCTVLLAWIAVFSLALKHLAPYVKLSQVRRSVGWAAAFGLVVLWVMPAHFREIRVWRQWSDHLWESETALVVGAYDEPLVRTLDYFRPKEFFQLVQDKFRPRRWSPFSRYRFEMGDALTAHFQIAATYPAAGNIQEVGPPTTWRNRVTAVVAGWGWDEPRRRAFHDILLTDARGRIVGLAHTTRQRPDVAQRFDDPARRRSGWLGFVRRDEWSDISAYGVIEGTSRVCPLVTPPP
jgi:hypothetical protein